MSALRSWRSCGHVAASTNLWPATPLESEQTKITSVLRASCMQQPGVSWARSYGVELVLTLYSLSGQGRFWRTKRFLQPCIIIIICSIHGRSGDCLVDTCITGLDTLLRFVLQNLLLRLEQRAARTAFSNT